MKDLSFCLSLSLSIALSLKQTNKILKKKTDKISEFTEFIFHLVETKERHKYTRDAKCYTEYVRGRETKSDDPVGELFSTGGI